MKALANNLGIYAEDQSFWSDTHYIRKMLADAGLKTSDTKIPFKTCDALPDLALLAIKHHQKDGKNFWH